MSNLITIILPFFALVVVGYGAVRFSILKQDGIAGINRFVYMFALPALLFSKTAETDIERVLAENTFVIAYVFIGLSVFVFGWISARVLLRTGADNCAVAGLAGCYGNIGFLGIPVLVSVLGGAAAAPLSIMLLIDVAFFIPFTTALIEASRSDGARAHLWGAKFLSIFKNPLIISIALGLAFSATGLGLPAGLGGFTNLLGQAAGPAAMFALGAVLAGQPISKGFGEAALISVLKLGVHPVAVWLGMTAFGVSDEWRTVATLGAATPVAASVFVIAQEYDTLPTRFSTAVVGSTAIALITLPLMIGWLS